MPGQGTIPDEGGGTDHLNSVDRKTRKEIDIVDNGGHGFYATFSETNRLRVFLGRVITVKLFNCALS